MRGKRRAYSRADVWNVRKGDKNMKKTISFHCGHVFSERHNFDKNFRACEEHIDIEMTDKNIIIIHETLKDVYDKLFEHSRLAYNKKQLDKGHPERQIDNYYKNVDKSEQQHVAYEIIIQIGDRNTTGINKSDTEVEIMKDFVKEFQERNPNFYIFGAVIHRDEKDGTDHLHLDYVPFGHSSRGMDIQNSLTLALKEQGFKTEKGKGLGIKQWTERERGELERLCRERGIEVEHKKENREHLEKQAYIQHSKNEELKAENRELEQELQEKRGELDKMKELTRRSVRVPVPKRVMGREYYTREQFEQYVKERDANDLKDRQELIQARDKALRADKAEQAQKRMRQDLLHERERAERFEDILQHSKNPKHEYNQYKHEYEPELEYNNSKDREITIAGR